MTYGSIKNLTAPDGAVFVLKRFSKSAQDTLKILLAGEPFLNPAQKFKTVASLPAMSPMDMLRTALGVTEAYSEGLSKELAKVTIHIQNATFTGVVSAIKKDGEKTNVLLLEQDDSVSSKTLNVVNLIYIPESSILAVKVHGAEMFFNFFSGGEIVAPDVVPNITEVRKKIEGEKNKLRGALQSDVKLEIVWNTLGQDGQSLIGLLELIDNFMLVVNQVVSDDTLRQSFRSKLTIIRLENAAEAQMLIDGPILIIRANLNERAKGRFSQEEFSGALLSIL